jgi:protein-tyrosine-phosphatase
MPIRVLFLCTGNSARSQMAEGLLQRLGGDRFDGYSAGTKPRPAVHPDAIRTMAEHEIDIREQRPKDVDRFADQRFDYVITVCDRAKEACPVIPGATMLHWSLPDPAEVEDERDRAVAFREVYGGLRRNIEKLIAGAVDGRPA